MLDFPVFTVRVLPFPISQLPRLKPFFQLGHTFFLGPLEAQFVVAFRQFVEVEAGAQFFRQLRPFDQDETL